MQLVSPHVIKNELNEIYNDTIKCMISKSALLFLIWFEKSFGDVKMYYMGCASVKLSMILTMWGNKWFSEIAK